MKQAELAEYEAFVAARWSPLFRTAYLLTGDYQLAEDLLQTAFTKVYLAWPRIQGLDRPEAYVRAMLTNQAISWKRRRSSTERPSDTLTDRLTTGHEDQVTDSAVLMTALATLPQQQRAIVVLRYYEDLSEAEIADALGIARGTVKSSASRALATLASRLGDRVAPRTANSANSDGDAS